MSSYLQRSKWESVLQIYYSSLTFLKALLSQEIFPTLVEIRQRTAYWLLHSYLWKQCLTVFMKRCNDLIVLLILFTSTSGWFAVHIYLASSFVLFPHAWRPYLHSKCTLIADDQDILVLSVLFAIMLLFSLRNCEYVYYVFGLFEL